MENNTERGCDTCKWHNLSWIYGCCRKGDHCFNKEYLHYEKYEGKRMKVKWLIEDYEHDSSLQPIMDEIEKQGMEYKIAKYEPWESCKLDHYPDKDCVVFYGTLNLGRQLQGQKGWIPGAYCNFKNLCCKTYYSYWGKYLFNQDYIMMPFLEIKRKQDWVFENYGVDDAIFIRPDSGAKCFTGQLLYKELIDKEYKLYANYAGKPLDEIMTVISSAKVIDKEWRCVVVDKKVVACSQYKKDGKLDISAEWDDDMCEVMFYSQNIADEEWQPDIAYTLDICKSNGEYSLLEANSFSCSGLYECDPEPIVRAVSKAALREWKEHNEPPEEDE
jgi:hypothetical protein